MLYLYIFIIFSVLLLKLIHSFSTHKYTIALKINICINFINRIKIYNRSVYLIVVIMCISFQGHAQMNINMIVHKSPDFVFNTMYKYIYGIEIDRATEFRISANTDDITTLAIVDWQLYVQTSTTGSSGYWDNALTYGTASANNTTNIPNKALQLRVSPSGVQSGPNNFTTFTSVDDDLPSVGCGAGLKNNIEGTLTAGSASPGDWVTDQTDLTHGPDFRFFVDYKIVPGNAPKFQATDCAGLNPAQIMALTARPGFYSITVLFVFSDQ